MLIYSINRVMVHMKVQFIWCNWENSIQNLNHLWGLWVESVFPIYLILNKNKYKIKLRLK